MKKVSLASLFCSPFFTYEIVSYTKLFSILSFYFPILAALSSYFWAGCELVPLGAPFSVRLSQLASRKVSKDVSSRVNTFNTTKRKTTLMEDKI